MNRATDETSEGDRKPATPIIKKMRWPSLLVWLIPILAAGLAGYYYYLHFEERGPLVTLKFSDATGLRGGDSKVIHLGVDIGDVTDIELGADHKQALVHVRLNRAYSSFAKQGAVFWIVRPEISFQEISGLSTVLSGPFIDATPGSGALQTEFNGLQRQPIAEEPGLHIILKAAHLEHLPSNSPVYFRGIQVGAVERVELSPDSQDVDVHVFIRRHFSPLVRDSTQFWVVSGIDVKGGLLSGVQMKVESLRSIVSGGIAFATADQNIGQEAKGGSVFTLHDDSKKEWLEWSPKIFIGPDDSDTTQNYPPPPKAAQAGH